MLGKVIAHGADRESARRRLITALGSLSVLGVTTNRDFLRAVLESERFASGSFSTSFLADEPIASRRPSAVTLLRRAGLAGLALWLADAEELRTSQELPADLCGWSSTVLAAAPLVLEGRGRFTVRIQAHDPARARFTVVTTDGTETATFAASASLGEVGVVAYEEAGARRTLRFARDGERFWTDAEGATESYVDVTYQPPAREESSDGTVRAAGAGRIVRVHVEVGDEVRRGQTLGVVESMKMELELAATVDGVVREVQARVGEQVAANRVLVVIEKAAPP
jgi:geranyl-CoA carboxylase alpha subunit